MESDRWQDQQCHQASAQEETQLDMEGKVAVKGSAQHRQQNHHSPVLQAARAAARSDGLRKQTEQTGHWKSSFPHRHRAAGGRH